jgi:hypothetical protein
MTQTPFSGRRWRPGLRRTVWWLTTGVRCSLIPSCSRDAPDAVPSPYPCMAVRHSVRRRGVRAATARDPRRSRRGTDRREEVLRPLAPAPQGATGDPRRGRGVSAAAPPPWSAVGLPTQHCGRSTSHLAPSQGCDCGIHAWHPRRASARRVLAGRNQLAGLVEAAASLRPTRRDSVRSGPVGELHRAGRWTRRPRTCRPLDLSATQGGGRPPRRCSRRGRAHMRRSRSGGRSPERRARRCRSRRRRALRRERRPPWRGPGP